MTQVMERVVAVLKVQDYTLWQCARRWKQWICYTKIIIERKRDLFERDSMGWIYICPKMMDETLSPQSGK